MKTCSKCGIEQHLDAFHVAGKGTQGRSSVCKPCRKEYDRERYAKKGEEIREVGAKWRAANIDRARERSRNWSKANRGAVNAANVKWRETNKHLVLALNSASRAKKLNATPSWANKKKIAEVYDFAQEFRECGFDVHVDHIVPLRGKQVSGLHVEQNLRVCLASVNLRKYNKQLEYYA